MKKLLSIMFLSSLLFYSCNKKKKEDSIAKWKNEILKTEKEFTEMAQKDGISIAFLTFAADDAVVMRNNSLMIGKKSLRKNFKNKESDSSGNSLKWKPDFVDVASSGDLGYTYGKYVFTTIDSTGNTKVVEGVFHTVWKRQPDGKWRFVWD